MIPVFDGHNDLLLRLWSKTDGNPVRDFVEGDGQGHLDLPRMNRGGFAGGFFAIFVPSPEDKDWVDDDDLNPPVAGEVRQPMALAATVEMASLLFRLEDGSNGRFRVCRSAAELREAMDRGQVAAILHIEGAEAIDRDLHALDVLYRAGLRSIGPVWSRSNVFGHGVPFRFPHSPDTGPGLTAEGKALVRRCGELKVLVDLSHLNERGFWDAAELGAAPLVATHSNAHALSPSSRNLTDAQLRAIGETGGMVGLNFANGFLRADGKWMSENGLDSLLRHLDYMMRLAGEDHVGLGSDFDGCRLPAQIGDAAGLPVLIGAMRAHGYGEDLIRKLAHGNWLAALERIIG
ncbi:MAG: dipeptidase [Hyphomicrobiales bacterium]